MKITSLRLNLYVINLFTNIKLCVKIYYMTTVQSVPTNSLSFPSNGSDGGDSLALRIDCVAQQTLTHHLRSATTTGGYLTGSSCESTPHSRMESVSSANELPIEIDSPYLENPISEEDIQRFLDALRHYAQDPIYINRGAEEPGIRRGANWAELSREKVVEILQVAKSMGVKRLKLSSINRSLLRTDEGEVYLLLTHCRRKTADKLLGKGGYSSVKYAVRLSDAKIVAVKVTRSGRYSAIRTGEVKILKQFQGNPLIVQLHGSACVDGVTESAILSAYGSVLPGEKPGQKLYLLLDYYGLGSLMHVLKKERTSGTLTKKMILSILIDLALALKSVHEQNVLHADIKPDNLLVASSEATGQLRPVLADFGISRNLNEESDLTAVTGTVGYIAPERYNEEIETDHELIKKSDVWSLGAVFYEIVLFATQNLETEAPHHFWPLCEGDNPWKRDYQYAMEMQALFEHPGTIIHDKVECLGDRVDPLLKEVIREMLHPNPRERLSAEAAYAKLMALADRL